MAEIRDSQQQTSISLNSQMRSGVHPLLHLVTKALPKLLACDTVMLTGLLPHTTERERTFNIVFSLDMSDTLLYQLLTSAVQQ